MKGKQNIMRRKLKRGLSKLATAGKFLAVELLLSAGMRVTALAGENGGGDFTAGLSSLLTAGETIVIAVGALVILFGGTQFASAFKERDSSGMKTAGLECAGGAIMIGIASFVAFFV